MSKIHPICVRTYNAGALSYIAQYGGNPKDRSIFSLERQHREFDGDGAAVFAYCPYGQRVAGSKVGFPGADGFVKTRPVAFAEIFWNNQVQRLADYLRLAETEDALGPSIPKPDNTLTIDKQHRIRRLAYQRTAETIKVEIRIHGRVL